MPVIIVFPLCIYEDYVYVLVFKKHAKIRPFARLLDFPARVSVIAVQEYFIPSLQYSFQQT